MNIIIKFFLFFILWRLPKDFKYYKFIISWNDNIKNLMLAEIFTPF